MIRSFLARLVGALTVAALVAATPMSLGSANALERPGLTATAKSQPMWEGQSVVVLRNWAGHHQVFSVWHRGTRMTITSVGDGSKRTFCVAGTYKGKTFKGKTVDPDHGWGRGKFKGRNVKLKVYVPPQTEPGSPILRFKVLKSGGLKFKSGGQITSWSAAQFHGVDPDVLETLGELSDACWG